MTSRLTTPTFSLRWLLFGGLLFGAMWSAPTVFAQYR